jgi:glycerol uptake facilitator protein
MEERGVPAYLAELLGTLLLVLFIGLVLSVHVGGLKSSDFAVIGLLHVFILAMLVASLGGASGAHFNPAVTITLLGLRKIRPNDAGIYIVMQLIGAVIGAAIVKLLLTDEGGNVGYGAVAVGPQLDGKASLGFLGELIGTFALMWAIMGTAVNPRAERSWAPLIIGGTLGAAVMCLGPLTGGGLNPARSFGPDLIAGNFDGFGTFLFAYCLGPILGALAAGFAYQTIVLEEQERLFGGRLVDADVPPGRVPGEVEAALEGPGERPIDKLS